LAIEQRGAVERREQPLVGIDDERVGPLEAVELGPDRRREERSTAVRAVDVKPQRSFLGHVSQTREIVDEAGVGRAGGGDHADHVVGAGMVLQRSAERGSRQPVVFSGNDERLHADDPECLAHRGVRFIAHRDQRTRGRRTASPVGGRVARHDECREVPG